MIRLRLVIRGGLLALVFCTAPAIAGLFSDPDRDWKEGDHPLPAAPREASLREFFVSSASPNHFLVDEDSIAVGEDGVVRYTLVIRAAGGATNVTREGIRCANGTWRLYATGRAGGEWSVARDADWQPIIEVARNRVRAALAEDHFCDGPVPPRNRDEVLRRLRGESGSFMQTGK